MYNQRQRPVNYGNPLPFRSNHSSNPQLDDDNEDYITRKPANMSKLAINRSVINHSNSYKLQAAINSSDNKENERAWIEAARYNINSNYSNTYHNLPPSASPGCSRTPSPPSSPVIDESGSVRSQSLLIGQNPIHSGSDHPSSSNIRAISTSRRHEKEISVSDQATNNIPDSPTGSTVSSGSDAGLLTLLASKLLSYAERKKRRTRYARENSSSGTIEKHMMEDRSIKPAVESLDIVPQPDHSQVYDDRSHDQLYRTSSEANSVYSLGSANDRTLSMEFDAMLAAASARQGMVETTPSSTTPPSVSRNNVIAQSPAYRPLQDIQEHQSLRYGSFHYAADQHHVNDTNSGLALVRVGDSISHNGEETSRIDTNALLEIGQGRGVEDMESITSGNFLESTVSHGSSRGAESEENNNNLQLVPTTTLQDTASSSYSSTSSPQVSSILAATSSSNSSANIVTDRDNKNAVPAVKFPLKQQPALAKLKRDKTIAQANAYQEAKNSQYNNRYMREESKIHAWENQQKIKATIKMKKVELKLEQKRAKALEKMENEIALAHKKAEQKKACAEAVRAAKVAKVAEATEKMRRSGKTLNSCCLFS